MAPPTRSFVPFAAAAVVAFAAVTGASSTAHADDYTPSEKTPAFVFGVQGGYSYWTEHGPFGTNTAIGQTLAVGYSVGLRASLEILPWLAVDARGTIFHNQGDPLSRGGAETTVGGFGAARLTLPFERIRPYALVGFGGYHHTASGATTTLQSGTVPAVVTGLGVAARASKDFDIGVEYTYSFLIGETLSSNEAIDGGDPSQVSFFVQYRLPL